jgi:hypothetical protein
VKRFLVLLALAPHSALACSVCYSANESNRLAFIGTTAFLSLFPLAMVGGIVWWIWKRVQASA